MITMNNFAKIAVSPAIHLGATRVCKYDHIELLSTQLIRDVEY